MRRLLFALPFALLPAFASAHGEHDHASLGTHEHGAAELNAALDGTSLEIELHSPAINLLGFEHAPRGDADERKVAETRSRLQQADMLFGLPADAQCRLDEVRLESPLFAKEHERQDTDGHSDIHAHYRFSCNSPNALSGLDLQGIFETFPGTEKVQAQLIGPNGQQGRLLRSEHAQITF